MLQRIADSANSMDLTKAGKEIGDLVNGLVTLMQVVAPVAATLGAGLVLEKTLAALAAFVGGVSASTTALAAETAALSANTAAQGANAAARVGPGAAWGKALPIPVATKGAPYSKEAYTSARNMGMNPETALMAARHAMVAAADGAAKATPLWTRLTGGLSTASAGLTKFLNNIMSVPNLLALGFASMSVGFMRDQASRFGYSVLGGATDATDQRKADEMRAAKSEQYAALAERVKNVGTQDDRDALAEEIAKTASEDASGIVSSKDAGDPRAAQNLVLKNSVANLSTLLGILGRKEGLLTPEEGLLNGLVTQSRDRIEAEQKRTELSSKSGADTFAADKFKDMSLPEQVSDLEKRRAQLGEAYNSSSSTDEEKNAALAVANNLLAQELDIRRKIKEEAKADAKTEKDNSAKRKDFFANLAISEAEYSGDKDGAARLKWNLDRMRLQKELEEMGSKDSWGESARMTNAQAAGKDARNFDKSVSSAMHAVGGARGEVYGAQSAVVAAVNKTNDLLQKIYGKPAVVVDTAARFS
jgi:hypothetical protein